MVRVSLIFDAGSSRDHAGRQGEALMTNHLLDEGAGRLSADTIAESLDGLGVELQKDAGMDMATIGIRSLSNKKILSSALDILRQLVRTPTFPKASLERERKRLLVGLKREEQSPGDVASKTFFRLTYPDHPYGRPASGDARSVKSITRKDLIAFHRRYYVGANAIMVVVGDLKRSQVERIARHIVGSLPRGQAAPKIAKPITTTRAQSRYIKFPSSQTHIHTGLVGMRRGDPDYFPLYVGNYILGGGGLVSRLSQEVREKHGLSYSVYSYFWPLRQAGPFIMGLQTRNNQSKQALEVLRQTLRQYVRKGPTAKELTAAKKHITGGFPLRLDNSGKIAAYLAVIGFYRLPLTYLDDFNARVEAVTLGQIRDAFHRRIDPDRMITVIVGGKT